MGGQTKIMIFNQVNLIAFFERCVAVLQCFLVGRLTTIACAKPVKRHRIRLLLPIESAFIAFQLTDRKISIASTTAVLPESRTCQAELRCCHNCTTARFLLPTILPGPSIKSADIYFTKGRHNP